MKKLNKLFFVREYTKGYWAVHKMRFTVVYRKFWVFRIAYLKHIGYDVVLKEGRESALALALQEKKMYIEALKYVSK